MNAQINTGGPAFPSGLVEEGEDQVDALNKGMTLRDYFAGKVLPSVYSSAMGDAANGSGLFKDPDWRMGLALEAYSMADALLRAREVV